MSLSVGAYTTLSMDDETAYQIVKTFWDQKQGMAKSNSQEKAVMPSWRWQQRLPAGIAQARQKSRLSLLLFSDPSQGLHLPMLLQPGPSPYLP